MTLKTTAPIGMTDRDYQRLQGHHEQHQARPGGMLPLVSVFCLVIGLLMLVMTAGVADGFGLILGIPVALGCGFFAWTGFSLGAKREKLSRLISRDLEQKRKIVVEGPITGKREEHYKYGASYCLKIQDHEYVVDVSLYTRCDQGDTVRLHLSENAKLPLDLEKDF